MYSPNKKVVTASLQVSVLGSLDTALSLTLTDADGHSVTANTGSVLLQPAAKRPMTQDDVIAAVGQLGDNVLAPVNVNISGLALEQGWCEWTIYPYAKLKKSVKLCMVYLQGSNT